MQDNATGNNGPASAEELGLPADGHDDAESPGARRQGVQAPPRPAARSRPRSGQAPPRPPARPVLKARGRRRLMAWVVGSAVGIAVGFGAGALVQVFTSSHSAGASSAIPSPPQANQKFVEDEEGTGADNQANILAATAPGLVHLVSSSGSSVGLGIVLTSSGLVATSAQILQGAGTVTVRVVLSGQSFPAQVVGSDAAGDLSLLQIKGGTGFRAIAIGTARHFPVGSVVTAVGSSGITKTLTLHTGNVTSMNSAATIDGTRLTGLLQTTSQVLPGEEVGGPVVNLSGQAVGIDVAGAGSGLHNIGFAVPIDKVLAVASQIDAKHS
jgi:S1-C subfamily serine protease